ncbi:MAG: radical SAM protein [Desulfobacterales bacterium]|nr:radical SAM protein [Desulfobacterales bacterium]
MPKRNPMHTRKEIRIKKERLKRQLPGAYQRLSCCTLCPRNCGADRIRNETGYCKTTDQAVVYGYMPHFGEEPPLSGTMGSGTIFFSHCSLGCCFCQNEDISIQGDGEPASPDQIARAMIILQDKGCHNINFVTPTHVTPFILKAIDLALDMGLAIPLVYNTSGYDLPETLKLLDGIIDIYMPDFKFWDPVAAETACNAPDYPEVARKALQVMHRQVGDLALDENGIAQKGLLVRHLVMPGDFAGTGEIMAFLAREISPETRVNIMSQYHPVGKAWQNNTLSRPVTPEEFRSAVRTAKTHGLVMVSCPGHPRTRLRLFDNHPVSS